MFKKSSSRIKSLFVFSLLSTVWFISCKKSDVTKNSTAVDELSQAKAWFEAQPHANMAINWEKAVIKDDDLVIAPVKWYSVTDEGAQVSRKLSIFIDSAGNRKAYIAEMVPSREYYDTYGIKYNKSAFDGTLSLLDLHLNFQFAQFFENGKRKYPAIAETYVTREIYQQTPKPEGCAYSQTAYYSGGVLTVIGYQVCTPDYWYQGSNPGGYVKPPEQPVEYYFDEVGGPDAGGGTPERYVTVDEVIDNTTNPCYKDVIKKFLNSSLQNTITAIICNIFDASDKVHLRFYEGKLAPDTDGDTSPQRSIKSGITTINMDVTINTDLAVSSKEYIAATICHEVLHAYFRVQGREDFLDHNEIALLYVDAMAQGIREVYPTISAADANALAWGGLTESYSWSEMLRNNPVGVEYINAVNKKHREGAAGTKCN